MKYITQYRTLTNPKYRLITNILIPVIAAFGMFLAQTLQQHMVWLLSVITVFLFCEIVGDYLGFGCICKKNAFGMDFLKCGYNGITYFKHAVFTDMFVRIVRITVCMIVGMIPYLSNGGSIWVLLDMIVVICMVSVASLNVTRYIDMAQYVNLVSGFLTIPAVVAVEVVSIFAERFKILLPAGAIVLVFVVAATYHHMTSGIEKSYMAS